MTNPQSTASAPRVALAQELSEFLIEFSIALHRTSMYPPGHPALEQGAGMVVKRLAALLLDRPDISIGVAGRQLVIEGVATDPNHPVLGTLADRLHRHQLGALVLERGVSNDELAGMMRLVAAEPDVGGIPLGLGDPQVLTQWQHLRLYPLTYEQLELVGGATGEDADLERAARSRPAQLWIGLARAALASEEQDAALESTEAAVVAEAINRHPETKGYDQVIVGYLLQLAQELRQEGGVASASVRKRLSRLVSSLDEGTLNRLIEMGGDRSQRRDFVLAASEALAADAVVDVVQAAASASDQTISHSMVRLLTKLSAFAEHGEPATQIEANNTLREQVQRMVASWDIADPNPGAYTRVLTGLARPGGTLATNVSVRYEPEPARIVQMALEVNAVGVPFWRAVEQLLEGDGLGQLMDLLAGSPADSEPARALWERLATPEQVQRQLARENIDFGALGFLFDHMDPATLAPLLFDTLMASTSRSTRLGVFKRLATMELPVVEPRIVLGLKDEHWFVQRNMLALLNQIGAWSDAVSPGPLARHSDPRVRREALQLWLRSPTERDHALYVGLSDLDERALRVAAAEARNGVPVIAVPLIARRALEPLPPELRSTLIRLLRGHKQAQALDTLLRTASVGRNLFGRYRLAPKSPECLAALAVLADTWADHADAAALLARARRSPDAEIRAAAQAPEQTP